MAAKKAAKPGKQAKKGQQPEAKVAKAAPKKELPPALAKRARGLAEKKLTEARARAEDLAAMILRRKAQIAEAFYDIGAALSELAEPALYKEALGHATFRAMVEERFGFSVRTAYDLMAVAREVTRERAIALGQTKALELVRLAAATPEDDTAETLARAPVALRGHEAKVEPGKLSSRAIRRATKTVRRAAPGNGAGEKAATGAHAAVARAETRLRQKDPSAKLDLVEVRRKGAGVRLELRASCALDACRELAKVVTALRP